MPSVIVTPNALHSHPLPPHLPPPQPLVFQLNNRRITLSPHDSKIPWDSTLLDYLRSSQSQGGPRLTGTKLGCGEGGCGACTVVVLRPKQKTCQGELPYTVRAVNACLVPLISAHGTQVLTVEGISTVSPIDGKVQPHPIQQRLAFLFGSQCGFCTPGIIMSFYATLRDSYATGRGLSERDIERSMDGNLCRCTGYRPILDALKTFATRNITSQERQEPLPQTVYKADVPCPKGADCCKVKNNGTSNSNSSDTLSFRSSTQAIPTSSLDIAKKRIGGSSADALLPYGQEQATSEPIFPPWLLKRNTTKEAKGSTLWESQDLTFVDVADQLNQQHHGLFSDDDDAASPSDESSSSSSMPKKSTQQSPTQVVWHRPGSLDSLLSTIRFYIDQGVYPKLRAGDSECRIEVRFAGRRYAVNIWVGHLQELQTFSHTDDEITIGAGLSLSDMICNLRSIKTEAADYKQQLCSAIISNASHFASTQIRNVACLGGNIATASPISDLNPVWLATGAHVKFIDAAQTSSEEQSVPFDQLFLGYRKTALPPSAVITRVVVPASATSPKTFVRAYKQAKRKDDDIAIVTCCLYATLSQNTQGQWEIDQARLAYGGMAPTTVLAKSAAQALQGSVITQDQPLAFDHASIAALGKDDFNLPFTVPGGMAVYRKTLAMSFLAKFLSEIAVDLGVASTEHLSLASSELERPLTQGSQDFEKVNVVVQGGSGEAIPHLSAVKQCTGEAEYVDDIAPINGELVGAFVFTTKANVAILKVDASPALQSAGGPATHFVGIDDLRRRGGKNVWCPPAFDDRFFADDRSEAVGLVIGVVLAHSKREAQAAAKLVRVEYGPLPGNPPLILDIDTAIQHDSYLDARPKIVSGSMEESEFDDDESWAKCDHVLQGSTRMGGQEHFYLETNAIAIIPGREDNEMQVWCSSQNPTETQSFVASVLNVPMNRIAVKTKRLGGGFGGKESRSVIIAATMALASSVAGVPVRCMLDRDEDIIFSGQRHPFMGKWKIGFSKEGKLQRLDVKVYNNVGWSQDLSRAVLERAMTHIDGVYKWQHGIRVRGWMCKTNTVSNTAFRGFGGPQGMLIVEEAIDQAARSIGMTPEAMRASNLNEEGDRTHYGQPLLDWNVPTMWQQVRESADFDARRKAIDAFNASSKWKKRGLTMVGTRFGISFTFKTLNQARCLLHIYAHDGSVMLSHGGTEMGQGLHTKVVQVAATELGIPASKIHIAHTSTREAANTSPTAASAGSDLNGAACKDACDQIKERLSPYLSKYATWEEAVHHAYFDRVNLSAVGHYKTPLVGMDWEKGQGEPFAYWTQGVICSEAEIDVLTGDSRVVRSDICMDIARSINPGIDIGQIEGAFTQGVGLVTMEESLWKHDGSIATKGPGNYKIPAFLDTPEDLRIAFLRSDQGRKVHHLRTVQGSKGVGEPPLALGAFHLFAIKDAIRSARMDNGLGGGEFSLLAPATAERIRLACGDGIVQLAKKGSEQIKEGDKEFLLRIS
ncbi:unnamed protein product [Sympodiomycopsis kandeliae]